jgi:hypothetical protein
VCALCIYNIIVIAVQKSILNAALIALQLGILTNLALSHIRALLVFTYGL